MPVTTRKSNASVHPGDIVRKAQKKKRTKKEMEDDRAKAQAESLAAKQEAARKHHVVISTIASLKASVERDEEAVRAHANRPDLCDGPSNLTQTALVLENQVPVRARKYTNTEYDIYDGAVLGLGHSQIPSPDAHEMDDEADSHQQLTLVDDVMMSEQGSASPESDNEKVLEFPESGDDKGDEMMDMDINVDSIMPDLVVPDFVNRASMKVTKSSERGLLRRQVNEFEETTSNKKRKASEMTPATNLGQVSTSVGTRPLKRSYAFHEGLTKNWRAQISHSSQKHTGNSVATAHQKGSASWVDGGGDTDAISVPVPGEFDDDEPIEILEKVRSSKSTAPKPRRIGVSQPIPKDTLESSSPPSVVQPLPARRTQQMGMKLAKVSASQTQMENSNASNNKKGYTHKGTPKNSDLPLPPSTEHQTKWTKTYVPELFAWAGSTDDPFGANGRMADEIEAIWERVFPDVILEDDDKPVVLKVAGAALHNWRSELRKAALDVVLEYWDAKLSTIDTPEKRSVRAKQEVKGLRFVYKTPATEDGIFCSYLVSKVYAAHLKKVAAVGNRYGLQIGGLALATVAVEYVLYLYVDKDSPIHALNPKVKVPNAGFLDNPWGRKAHLLQKTIAGLRPQNWAMIDQAASNHLKEPTQPGNKTINKNDEDSYPHAHLVIKWYVLSN